MMSAQLKDGTSLLAPNVSATDTLIAKQILVHAMSAKLVV